MGEENDENIGRKPPLRFPEFREAAEWRLEPLSKLAKRRTNKNITGKHTRVLTNSAEYGVVDQRDYFEKNIANKENLEGYYIVDKGDYVYNPRISSTAPVGPISKNRAGLGVMSPLYTVFRFNEDNNDFYAHYFKSSHWHNYLRRSSSTGARHDRMSITNNDLMDMPLPCSTSAEQQKIADCLSSVDELISVETQKLDTLKTYKKGIMQHIFPRDGESVPRLRFPEFQEKGNWEEFAFSKVVTRSFYGTSNSTSDSGAYPVLRMGNMVDGGLDVKNLAYIDLSKREFEKIALKKGDILLNRTNSMDLVGKISLFDLDKNYVAASYIVTFRLDTEAIDPTYCKYFLNTSACQEKIKGLATRAISQANINPNSFQEKIMISLPSKLEQGRVADYLTCLDDILTAQRQKVDALKEHKKGLMQQLFPAWDEAKI